MARYRRMEEQAGCTTQAKEPAAIYGQFGDTWINLAAQAAKVGFWSWDIARDRVVLTEPGQALHGLTCATRMSYRAWLMTLCADDREPAHQAMQRALGDKTDYRIEYRIIRPDGSTRWIAARGTGFFDDAGKPLWLTGALFDATVHKRVEQALKDQCLALFHMERVSTLGGLSAALAHELNQPLTAILCNAQAGLRFLAQASPDPEILRAILADIAADNQRASAVISQLRALLKKEGGGRQAFGINALVGEVAQLLRSEIIARQVSLSLRLDDGLPETKGDPVQVRQVLLNLAMNAVEAVAASAGGARELHICTGAHGPGGIEVVVRDTGGGIAPQMLEQIFEPFVTGKPHGLGMGLAISRAIVTAHSGRLWAGNAPEGGAVLRFTLPVARE
jgi:two-component system sensor kinase FixL